MNEKEPYLVENLPISLDEMLEAISQFNKSQDSFRIDFVLHPNIVKNE